MSQAGTLIALEGIDGCGKSLQTRRLAAALTAAGHAVSVFREPGDTEPGRELRRIFVEGRDISAEQEVSLFLEDRRIDVRDNIRPALARGEIVIMDRYYLSSVVYQGALGLDPEEIRARNEAFAPRPHLTVVLDLDPVVARRRIHAARGSANSFEGAEYLARVRALYLRYVDGESIVRVDASTGPGAVHREVMEQVRRTLERRGQAA